MESTRKQHKVSRIIEEGEKGGSSLRGISRPADIVTTPLPSEQFYHPRISSILHRETTKREPKLIKERRKRNHRGGAPHSLWGFGTLGASSTTALLRLSLPFFLSFSLSLTAASATSFSNMR